MEREYWVVTTSGVEVSGPYASEQDGNMEARSRQPEWEETLIVINSDDAY